LLARSLARSRRSAAPPGVLEPHYQAVFASMSRSVRGTNRTLLGAPAFEFTGARLPPRASLFSSRARAGGVPLLRFVRSEHVVGGEAGYRSRGRSGCRILLSARSGHSDWLP